MWDIPILKIISVSGDTFRLQLSHIKVQLETAETEKTETELGKNFILTATKTKSITDYTSTTLL